MVIKLLRKSSAKEPKHFKRKVLLLGDGAVGKTSLIRRFVVDKFDDKYIATIGTKVTKKELELQGRQEKINLTLMIWDVLGQKGYRTVQSSSFRGADGVILVCDFTRGETLRSLEDYWMPNIGKNLSNLRLIFVANKSDLSNNAQFSMDDIKAMASKYNSMAFPSSAKTGENVENVFISLGKMLIDAPAKEETHEPEPVLEPPQEARNLVDATDIIINDFCQGYGDMEVAMSIIRQQFTRAGMDIQEPTEEGLFKVIDLLAEVEEGVKDPNTVKENITKRRLLVRKANT
ncbi:MAG: hypothetical protein A7315_05020 [Candidatus Altiarchaeales archaeon WOR_SM1_79]|nr:MAG: hypothetical protein A7315_05020 [Candidatus Altiarchaeales archaeon WOR_SM1_79]